MMDQGGHVRVRSRLARIALTIVPLMAMIGCAAVPRTDLDTARSQVRSLRTELAEAKDSVARLRAENRDMAARAVEESRRLAELEESNQHLEKSIAAYQEERNEYASALDQIRRAVVVAGEGRRTAGAASTTEERR